MFKERLARLSELTDKAGLQNRTVWKDGNGDLTLGCDAGCQFAGVDVAFRFRHPGEVHDDPPEPPEDVIASIRALLETDDLEVQQVAATDELCGLIVELTALRYTVKR